MVRAASRIALLALMLVVASTAAHAASARFDDVKVSTEEDATVVLLHTSRVPRYTAELIDSPNRLVLDLQDTTYGWRDTPLVVSTEPIKAVRGSQFRKDRVRVVIELTRRVGFVVREDAAGLAVMLPTATPTAPSDTPVSREAGTESAGTAQGPSRRETARPLIAQAAPAPAPARPAPPAATAPPTNGQRLISLDFKEADVVNLLRILAAESGRNIVIGEDVKGKMSISLRNVPWEQALETILESRGLSKVEKDGVIRIVSNEQLTKEREAAARVEEAKLKGEAELRAKVAEAAVKEAEAQTRKMANEAAQREQEARGPLREETIRLSYADPEEVEETLRGILGLPRIAKGGGPAPMGQSVPSGPTYIMGPAPLNPELPGYVQPSAQPLPGPLPVAPAAAIPVSVSQDVLAKGLTIRAHKPTNTLFMRLYARDLEVVKKLIREALDIPLPQVKIEGRMEILDRTALEQLGIQWGGGMAQPAGPGQVLVGQGYQTTTNLGQVAPVFPGFVTPDGKAPTIGDFTAVQGLGSRNIANTSSLLSAALPVSSLTGLPLGGNVVNLPLAALPTGGTLPAAGVTFGLIGSRYNINLALQALSERGKTRTLARPEIVTVENNRAAMSLGEEIPFATVSSAGTQIQFKEALLKLEVTPTVIREPNGNKIKMLVVVENNDRGATVNLGSAGNPPAINRRKAETQVLINEGERLVIGGVMTRTQANTVRKVPIFGDIPILGWLFKSKEDSETGRELVVFVTPTILFGGGVVSPPPPPPLPPPPPPSR
jgi:type IV pilus assembly protein PilQ